MTAKKRSWATRPVLLRQFQQANDTPDKERLSLLRLNLKENFETIKALNTEVIDLIEDESLPE